ncbi:MDR family MFS transporter [Pelagibacterium montanilacus]|uniref:MDR family MFS transporter n=1 Tax=Pelagibacterium montanilacus TaxID=2185280 RepID=UPI001FECE185|nr:MDR family MFS transporter [Pelagibacterium montanilacus]
MATSEHAQPTHDNPRLAIASAIAVMLLAALGQTIITPALPIIVGDLGGLEHISWAMTAYLLAATVGSPLFGKLGDTFGRKIVLQAGIGVFLVGSVVSAMAPNMAVLVLGRFVQGFGGGGLIVTAMATVADVLPPRERGRAQAFVGIAFAISTVVGPLLGGLIVENLSWPWLFAVNVPVGLLAFGAIAYALETRRNQTRQSIDYAGAVLLAVGLSALVLFTSLGGTVLDWFSFGSLALVGLAIAALAGFAQAEKRAANPMMPLFLFRNNAFLVSNIAGLAVGTVMFGAITFIPFYLQVVKGFSPTGAGLGLLPMMLGIIGMSMASGIVMSRTGRYKILPIFGALLMALGCVGLATITATTPFTITAVYLAVLGMGIGPAINVGVTAIQNAVPREVLGVGTASANMFRQIGGSVGVAVLGAVFGNRLVSEVGEAAAGGGAFDTEAVAQLSDGDRMALAVGYAEALHPVFWLAAIAAACAFGVSWLLEERPLEGREKPAQ